MRRRRGRLARAANHQQAPHHNKRGAAGRLNKGSRAAPAPKQYAHPSIADSMQLLRDLEAELPVGAAKKGSDEDDDEEDEVETPPLATKPPLPPMTPSFAADVEKQAEQLRDSSLRDLLAEARRLTLDCSDIVEKRELADRLLAHKRASGGGSPPSPPTPVTPSTPATPPAGGQEPSPAVSTPPPQTMNVAPPPPQQPEAAATATAMPLGANGAAAAAASNKRLPRMGRVRRGGVV